MKKQIAFLVVLALLCSCISGISVFAKNEKAALYTDFEVYICGVAFPCYEVDGEIMIVFEDLVKIGFDAQWTSNTGTGGYSLDTGIENMPQGSFGEKQVKAAIYAEKDPALVGQVYRVITGEGAKMLSNGQYVQTYMLEDGRTVFNVEALKKYGEENSEGTDYLRINLKDVWNEFTEYDTPCYGYTSIPSYGSYKKAVCKMNYAHDEPGRITTTTRYVKEDDWDGNGYVSFLLQNGWKKKYFVSNISDDMFGADCLERMILENPEMHALMDLSHTKYDVKIEVKVYKGYYNPGY